MRTTPKKVPNPLHKFSEKPSPVISRLSNNNGSVLTFNGVKPSITPSPRNTMTLSGSPAPNFRNFSFSQRSPRRRSGSRKPSFSPYKNK